MAITEDRHCRVAPPLRRVKTAVFDQPFLFVSPQECLVGRHEVELQDLQTFSGDRRRMAEFHASEVELGVEVVDITIRVSDQKKGSTERVAFEVTGPPHVVEQLQLGEEAHT